MQQDDAMPPEQDEANEADDAGEHDQPDEPENTEAYVPGTANGRNYMARLCRVGDGPWTIDVVHVEGLPPLADSGRSWASKDEAAQAANLLVAALAH